MDWYRVEVPKNDAVSNKTVTATPIGVDFDSICLIVQDTSGEVLNSVNGSSWMAQPGATYYISVTRKDGVKDLPAKIFYSLSIETSVSSSDLKFKPLDWGTFVYDNDPEFITVDDLADYNFGNRLLMSADGLSGVVDVQSSHSVKKYMLENGNVSFDVLLYNPTNTPVTVEVERLGFQLPQENDVDWNDMDQTNLSWACLKAWADYLQIDLKEELSDDKKAYTKDSTFQGKKEFNYHSYAYNRNVVSQLHNNGKIIIQPGELK